MAFLKNKTPQIGEWVKTKKSHSNMIGRFTVGTYVQIVDITERGYSIEDKYGNRITEIGWNI